MTQRSSISPTIGQSQTKDSKFLGKCHMKTQGILHCTNIPHSSSCARCRSDQLVERLLVPNAACLQAGSPVIVVAWEPSFSRGTGCRDPSVDGERGSRSFEGLPPPLALSYYMIPSIIPTIKALSRTSSSKLDILAV
jgi:hypothetical protein